MLIFELDLTISITYRNRIRITKVIAQTEPEAERQTDGRNLVLRFLNLRVMIGIAPLRTACDSKYYIVMVRLV